MSHDLESDWASQELVRQIIKDPKICFSSSITGLSAYAGRESNKYWPFADGIIELENPVDKKKYFISVEYKRPNEGTHGVLTAIGQSHAYLKKGFHATIMILPDQYNSLPNVGKYVTDLIHSTSGRDEIGVCTYSPPDSSQVSPFRDKLTIHKPFLVDPKVPLKITTKTYSIQTQWAHVREGSTEADAFYKYLSAVKLMGGEDASPINFRPPKELIKAVKRVNPLTNPLEYLSYCTGQNINDKAWQYFWFKNVLNEQMMIGWKRDKLKVLMVNHVLSNIEKSNKKGKKAWFSGKSNSIKDILVNKIKKSAITEDTAWEELAKNFHERAHSYREDIDSGLENIGFIEKSGRMSASGYEFLEACEKSQDSNSFLPISLIAKSLLKVGGFNTLLHYIHRLSEEIFKDEPLLFSYTIYKNRKLAFKGNEYLNWLEDELANNLKVLKKVSKRGGQSRQPLQAELYILRHFKIISKGYRIGVGIHINWPVVQSLLD